MRGSAAGAAMSAQHETHNGNALANLIVLITSGRTRRTALASAATAAWRRGTRQAFTAKLRQPRRSPPKSRELARRALNLPPAARLRAVKPG